MLVEIALTDDHLPLKLSVRGRTGKRQGGGRGRGLCCLFSNPDPAPKSFSVMPPSPRCPTLYTQVSQDSSCEDLLHSPKRANSSGPKKNRFFHFRSSRLKKTQLPNLWLSLWPQPCTISLPIFPLDFQFKSWRQKPSLPGINARKIFLCQKRKIRDDFVWSLAIVSSSHEHNREQPVYESLRDLSTRPCVVSPVQIPPPCRHTNPLGHTSFLSETSCCGLSGSGSRFEFMNIKVVSLSRNTQRWTKR